MKADLFNPRKTLSGLHLTNLFRIIGMALLSACICQTASATSNISDESGSAVQEGNASSFLYSSENLHKLPTISAVLKKYNERNPEMVVTNWVKMSPNGMRIMDADTKAEIIKNFAVQRVWLTNNKNKTSHEIDIALYQEHFPEQVQYLVGPESLSNISGIKPCADFVGKNSGKRVWRGQVVEVWDCHYTDGVKANTQLFSNRWNIVVQVKHADMQIEELVDIKQEQLTETTFVPDSTLRHVEITEFMTGRALLDTYSP